MATKGQYWTEAQRVATEGKAFWVERMALLYTIIVAPWLEKPPCPETPAQGVATCLIFPSHWHISLMMAFTIAPAFYLCRWLYKIEVSSWTERTLFWVERLLVLVSIALVPTGSLPFFLTLILFSLSLLASGMYLACFLDRNSYLRWIMWDYNDNDYHEIGENIGISEEEKDHDNGKNVDISEEEEEEEEEEQQQQQQQDNDNGKNVSTSKERKEEEEEEEELCAECWRNMKREDYRQREESCKLMLAKWEAKLEKLEVKWLAIMEDMKREDYRECEESSKLMLAKWEAKLEKLEDKWLEIMEDMMIATEKKQQRAEDVYQEDRRKWEEEKVQLAGKLSAAIAAAELYRNLLHDNVGVH